MENPYTILGISSSATDEEVTRAYRKLAKKYHPDLNPGDKTAEHRMREVNAAYEQIKTQKTGGASYERTDGSYGPQQHTQTGGYSYRGEDPFGGFGFGGFGDIFGDIFGQAWQDQNSRQQESSPNFRQVRLFIQARRYQDAFSLLEKITERNAEWYYLCALTSAGMGNRVTALSHAKEAVRMEPGNAEYQRLLNQFQRGGYTYQQTGQSQGFNMKNMGRGFLGVILAQMACFFCCNGGC